jgi:hypothetical protein
MVLGTAWCCSVLLGTAWCCLVLLPRMDPLCYCVCPWWQIGIQQWRRDNWQGKAQVPMTTTVLPRGSCGFLDVVPSPMGGRICTLTLLLIPVGTVILGPNSAGLTIVVCCLRFHTPPTWRARSEYLCLLGTERPSYAPGITHLLWLIQLTWQYLTCLCTGKMHNISVCTQQETLCFHSNNQLVDAV